ncbi:MAG: VOC family protein [Pseudomonadota bacterium]
MDIVQNGIVLKTEYYKECLNFYCNVLDLPVVFSEDHGTWSITCLAIGEGYLMVETGGNAAPPEKTFAQSPIKLRLNVSNLAKEVEIMREKGIIISIQEHDWGEVAEICDPDGNRIALRQDTDIYRLKQRD